MNKVRINKERVVMDQIRKSKLFAAFIFAFTVLIYAAIAPLGHGGENTATTQTNTKHAHPLERIVRASRVAADRTNT
jgi:hypothetical protein